jgi:hypothetical protein
MPRPLRLRRLLVACLVLPSLFAGACGYQTLLGPVDGRTHEGLRIREAEGSGEGAAPDRSRTPVRPTRLAVIALRNDSPEPWLDRIVTESLRREVGNRGGFDLVNDPSQAELVIRGRIRPLDIRAESYSSFVAAVQFALTLSLDLEVVRSGGDVVRLDSEMLSETDVYLASGDIEVTRTNRLELLRHLSDLLAARLADSLELMQRPMAAVAAGGGG